MVNSVMAALVDGGPQTVAHICRSSGVPRTTFYRYFESFSDLEERFLHLFFQEVVSDRLQRWVSLTSAARSVADCMSRNLPFFQAVYTGERMLKYRYRWKSLVDGWLMRWLIGRVDDFEREFSLGVVERYLELAAVTDDIDRLTSELAEYLGPRLAESGKA